MKLFSSLFKWRRGLSISNKLYLVVGTMALLIVVELLTLWFSVNTLSSVRAFVGGEGLWSKAQKDAIYNLRKYTQSGKEEDYQKFLHFLEVPLGDRKARIEMAKENPDYNIIRQGFLEGRNHPDDIDGMIKLCQRFDNIYYIQNAIRIWTEADSLIFNLQESATELHSAILLSGVSSPEKIMPNLNQVNGLNEKLTLLEDEFSATLGEGSRWLENMILRILLSLALTVEISGILLTVLISKNISKGLQEIIRVVKQVAKGNFKDKAVWNSKDEIGMLATSFNKMTHDLEKHMLKLQNAEKKIKENAEELTLKENSLQYNQGRINELIEVLVKYTMMDFSQKISISKKHDGLDALAIGLNTLSEELENQIQQLKEGEEQIQTIFKNAPDAVVVIDEESKIVRWNPRAEGIFGWDAHEVIGKNIKELIIPHRFREAHQNGMNTFLKTKKGDILNKPLELPALRKDNTEFDAGISISPTVLKGKNFFIGFVSDISYRKKAEAEIQKKSEELARSNNELEQFAYVASHDLQEPLRMVSSFLQLLEKHLGEKLDKESREYIDYAIDGSKRMRNLINSLLEYSRVNIIKPYEWVDVDAVVNTVLHNLNEQIKVNNVIIKRDKLPVIYADAVLIGQLFQNILTNAIKFRGEKNPEIKIFAKDEKTHWLFSISDNGIGIQKEYFDKIFVIFQRLHARKEFPGTGIGLAICKKIVDRHGGKIWVESELGKGATFYVTIPK